MKHLFLLLLGTAMTTSLFGAGAMLQNGEFSNGAIDPWQLILLNGAAGTCQVVSDGPDKKPAALVTITSASQEGEAWQVGFNQNGIHVSKGKSYRLTFQVKGSGVPSVTALVGPSHPPYGSLPGIERKVVPVTGDWQKVTYDFTVTEDEEQARVLFYNFNVSGATIGLSAISLVELPSS